MIPITDFLWNAAKYPPKPVCVIYGNDAFLVSLASRKIRDAVLTADDSEFSISSFEGNVPFKDVLMALNTRSMFGTSRRLVHVEDANAFIKGSHKDGNNREASNRDGLTEYAQKPSQDSILLLELTPQKKDDDHKKKSGPPQEIGINTRFYKEVDSSGLIIEANALPEKDMKQWLVQWSKHQYQTVCKPEAAELILYRTVPEHGLLDQELAKLSLLVKKGEAITEELVRDNVGAWRTITVFQILDCALEGKTAEAVRQLDNLLLAGEKPIQILGAVSVSLRRFASATQLVLDAEKQGKKMSVESALQQTGVPSYFVQKSKEQMFKLGRYRGTKLSKRLLQLDLDLKGDSRTPPRILLERFIIWLSNTQLRPTG